jgi:hypothetical protein
MVEETKLTNFYFGDDEIEKKKMRFRIIELKEFCITEFLPSLRKTETSYGMISNLDWLRYERRRLERYFPETMFEIVFANSYKTENSPRVALINMTELNNNMLNGKIKANGASLLPAAK